MALRHIIRAMSSPATPPSRLQFGRTNALILGAGVISLAAGYWCLSRGSTTAAPLLLVIGYCVLVPLGLGL